MKYYIKSELEKERATLITLIQTLQDRLENLKAYKAELDMKMEEK